VICADQSGTTWRMEHAVPVGRRRQLQGCKYGWNKFIGNTGTCDGGWTDHETNSILFGLDYPRRVSYRKRRRRADLAISGQPHGVVAALVYHILLPPFGILGRCLGRGHSRASFPRLKMAYAGIFFDLTGATRIPAPQSAATRYAFQVIARSSSLCFTVASWALYRKAAKPVCSFQPSARPV